MKIALTADWHLRAKHLQTIHRGPDFAAAAKSSVMKAKEAGVTAILNGGDTFHDSRPTSQNGTDLQEVDDLLNELKLPMYTIDGNHDRAVPSWLDTLTKREDASKDYGVLNINNRTQEIRSGNEVIRVHGIPPMDREDLIAYLNDILPKEKPDVILWHGALREMCGYPDPTAVSIEELPTDKLKAFLCGDIHKRQFIHTGDGCLIGYPGATELSDKSERAEDRSIEIIDTSSSPWTHERVVIDTRPVHAFHILSHEHMEEVVEKLGKLPKDPWPIVFIAYDAEVHPRIKERLHNALDNPKAILRAKALPKINLPLFSVQRDDVEMRELKDFVPQFFHRPGPLRDLATTLCNDKADHRKLLEEYASTAIG